ncbi:hypothetical protein G3I13_20935 [Streptomyces sp. SID6673]|nr:hypothetical protein [Streptomyces sp. SID11726]NEB26805.1 hypothetical protein [Streptomyces sp. SID6673]NED66300.1 hypothetical protein [Streptomyces sp. SID10244]
MTPTRGQLDTYDPADLLTTANGLAKAGQDAESLFDRYVSSVTTVAGVTWEPTNGSRPK